jgi:S-adenosylmethionine-dependent methyltransferase
MTMPSRLEQEAAIRQYYNSIVEEEDSRLETYPFEFEVTIRFIAKYLDPSARLLDAACGTGRYAEALLAAGFFVGASDLADANVRAARELLRGKSFTGRLQFVRESNALDASTYAGGPWDGILLMGPCYHLPERKDRVALLQQARAHLAPGGLLYVSFVSRIAAFWWGLQHRPEGIFEAEGVRTLLISGTEFNFAVPGDGLPNCYFCDPDELETLFADAGLAVQHVCATEGPFGGRVARFHELDRSVREAWLEFIVQNCEAPIFRSTSEHLLVVARRK